jgi:hypothetical protein
MTAIKINRVKKLSITAKYPRTFAGRLGSIPDDLMEALTAKQIAAIIDGPMDASYKAGHTAGYRDAK